MRGVAFVPLACPACGDDLAGRAADRVAFCRACRTAFRCDGGRLAALPASTVVLPPPGSGPGLALPFWARDHVAVPAFLTARPLTLTRVATRLLPGWPLEPGLAGPLPLGARVRPEAISRIAALARPGDPGAGALRLLAVPARQDGHRFRLAGFEGELFRDDIRESEDLVRLATPAPTVPA
ncbi:MAG: hypothetical protein KBD01_15980 [Acidobacteria bacterium]|nr:hypothetical protein [Acidobacteriota bacterium]